MESTGDHFEDMLVIPSDTLLTSIVNQFETKADTKIDSPDINLEVSGGVNNDKVSLKSSEWKTNGRVAKFLRLAPEKEREILFTWQHDYSSGGPDPKTGRMTHTNLTGYETVVFKQEQSKDGTIKTYLVKSRSADEERRTSKKLKPVEWPANSGDTQMIYDVVSANLRILQKKQ